MTLPEFIEQLQHTPGPWRLDGDTILHADGACPLCAVAGMTGSIYFWVAADHLGIEDRLANLIAETSDGYSPRDPKLRRQLLQATVEREAAEV